MIKDTNYIALFVKVSFDFACSTCFFSPSCSPELEKGLKKRVKLHTHENGEHGQSRENGQNGEIDSDDNYTEVGCSFSSSV